MSRDQQPLKGARQVIQNLYGTVPESSSLTTRDILHLWDIAGTLYKAVFVIGRRAAQIHSDLKRHLREDVEHITGGSDLVAETYLDQINAIVRDYEEAPDPVLIAVQEFEEGKTYFRFLSDTDKSSWES